MEDLRLLARIFGVPLADVVMIAVNTYGVRYQNGLGRARCNVLPDAAPDRVFRSIVATARDGSPFDFEGDRLTYGGETVARVADIEHDDARLGYFRDSQRVVTLNTNARSHCTGCVFCPNTGSDASDPKVDTASDELAQWLRLLCARSGIDDLTSVAEVNLSTSCFGEELAAIEHLRYLRRELGELGFAGRIGILSSVIRSRAGFQTIADEIGKFALFLTLECVTQRNLWLKDTKASLSADAALEVLVAARDSGCEAGVNLVVGLDPIDALTWWLEKALDSLTDFPNLQVFQVHSRYMRTAAVMGERPVEWMLEARHRLERVLAPTALRPQHWQNYRPFWYTEFAEEELCSPGTLASPL